MLISIVDNRPYLCSKTKVKVNYVYHVSKTRSKPDVHDREDYLSLKNAYSNVQDEILLMISRQIYSCKQGELKHMVHMLNFALIIDMYILHNHA